MQVLEAEIAKGSFWNDPEAAKPILQERTCLTALVDKYETIFKELQDAMELLDLAMAEEEDAFIREIEISIRNLRKKIQKFSIGLVLSAPEDSCSAIFTIHAGAGGTEAQDWAEMLFRMYSRWCDQKRYKIAMIDYQAGEEAGLKSVTFSVGGDFAYGYLKAETGIHRLVRISPFNANGKRQTSFASVFVYPEINDEVIIDIEEKDLRIDVYRASGAGGQHVNKTSSAVRITHLPTGIVVQCQQEKSQYRNKEMALKVLKSRLYQAEQERQNEKLREMHAEKDDIGWGNQIRSYVLQPYQMVKDHRFGLDVGNVSAVLDGDLDVFIEGYLLQKQT